jgi:hypothetical protein
LRLLPAGFPDSGIRPERFRYFQWPCFSGFLELSVVPGAGIEPAYPQGARDFKSLASTSSATQARFILPGNLFFPEKRVKQFILQVFAASAPKFAIPADEKPPLSDALFSIFSWNFSVFCANLRQHSLG